MIYAKLLDGVRDEWTIMEKVFYLLYKICENSYYDVRVKYLIEDTELHKMIYNKNIDIDKDEDRRIICIIASKILSKLLNRINIKSELVCSRDSSDFANTALLVQDENNRWFFINVVATLYACKLHIIPIYLGATSENYYEINHPISKLSNTQIKDLCIQIGAYDASWDDIIKEYRNTIKNRNDFIKTIKSDEEYKNLDIQNLSPFDILKLKVDYINRKQKCNMEYAGPSEIEQFYTWLYKRAVFNSSEQNYISMDNYFKRIGDEVDVICVLEIWGRVLNGIEHKFYAYKPEKRCYESIEREELEGYKKYERRKVNPSKKSQEEER